MNVNTTMETKFNGVVTCSQSSDGKITRTVSNVCVGNNHDYHKVGDVWTSGNVQFTCKAINGTFHSTATGTNVAMHNLSISIINALF